MNQNQEYNQEIIKILKESKFSYSTILKSKKSCKHLLDYIIEWCKSVNAPSNIPFPTMIYWTINALYEQPKCSNINCNNRLPINAKCSPLTGFGYRCCSMSCAQKDPKHRLEQQKKSLIKYGTICPQQSDSARQKMKKTLASKPKQHWEKANKKRTATLQQKYGNEITNVSQLESHKINVSNTWNLKSKKEIASIINSRKQTNLEKYGNENYHNSKKISETKKNFSKDKKLEIINKTKTTNLKIYGTEYVWHRKNDKLKAKYKRCKSKYDNLILSNEIAEPLFTFEEYITNINAKFKWKCKKCGDIFECGVYEHQPYVARCLKCNPLSSTHSKNETAIIKFLQENGYQEIIENTRKIIPPKELDIFIPSKKLAIEYNGIWWHSLANETPIDYHLLKSNACENIGINLIHILDYEWTSRQNLCKRKLLEEFYDTKSIIDQNTIEIAENTPPEEIRNFIIENSLEDPLDFNLDNALVVQTNDSKTIIIAARSKTTKRLKLVKKLGFKVNEIISKMIKNHFGSNIIVEVPRAWPSECRMLENDFKMKLISVEQPRVWCYKYNNNDIYMHLASNISNISDNDYLIPDAGTKLFAFA